MRAEMEEALLRDDPLELQSRVLEVALEAPDAEWAEVICARLAKHRNAHVRGNAIQGFGHLARRFGHLDSHRVQRLMNVALHDLHEYVSEQALSAADDLETFLGWRFQRPDS